MANLINFEIVTPEKTIIKEKVISVTVPTTEGEITVLAHHIPIVSILKPGIITVRKEDASIDIMSVSGGFIEVLKNKIVIMADTAERAEDIDTKRAEEAKQRAEETMKKTENIEEVNFADVNANIAKELARIKAANKWKDIKPPHHIMDKSDNNRPPD